MNRVLKWVGIGVAGVLGLIVVLGAVLHFVGSNRLNNAPTVAVRTVTVTNDDATIQRGEHLATISLCKECHGPDLSGTVFADEAPMGYLPAVNLTSGAGGVGATYTAEDWARAIRHGVGADGRSLLIMPSYHYDSYSDEDLAALIAYLQSLPPVDNELSQRRIDFPGTIIFGLLAYGEIAGVAQIDHGAVGQASPVQSESAEYGKYLVDIASCGSCHAENLAGGTDPNTPLGPNLTQGGELQAWSQEDFALAMRAGMTPEGRQLSEEMPWYAYAALSDAEIAAIWAHLQSVPALASNTP